jgi:hypothetical protein
MGVYARGLCRKEYLSARHLVLTGKTTWDKLVKSGKALESNQGARREWFLSK